MTACFVQIPKLTMPVSALTRGCSSRRMRWAARFAGASHRDHFREVAASLRRAVSRDRPHSTGVESITQTSSLHGEVSMASIQIAGMKQAREHQVARLVFAHIGRPALRAIDADYRLPFGEWGKPGRTYQLPPRR